MSVYMCYVIVVVVCSILNWCMYRVPQTNFYRSLRENIVLAIRNNDGIACMEYRQGHLGNARSHSCIPLRNRNLHRLKLLCLCLVCRRGYILCV